MCFNHTLGRVEQVLNSTLVLANHIAVTFTTSQGPTPPFSLWVEVVVGEKRARSTRGVYDNASIATTVTGVSETYDRTCVNASDHCKRLFSQYQRDAWQEKTHNTGEPGIRHPNRRTSLRLPRAIVDRRSQPPEWSFYFVPHSTT